MKPAADLPGLPRPGVDPADLQKQIRALALEVARLAERDQVSSFPAIDLKEGERPRCFIVMPFGREDLNVVFDDFVRPVVEDQCELVCTRGDDIFGSNVVMDDVRSAIADAQLVIADLTGQNANVFYELGICHTLNKPVLLLAQSLDDVPFDVRHLRVLLYEYNPHGCKQLECDLKAHVLALLERVRQGD